MKLSEAYPICKQSVNIRFKELFPSSSFTREEIIQNKGKSGQLMEKLCGLKLLTNRKDFEDGELKTSELKESTAITMITDWIDQIIHGNPLPFDKTPLAEKIEHMIFMPLEKPSDDPYAWFFKDCIYIQITKGSSLYNYIKENYENICQIAHEQVYSKKISKDLNITTSSSDQGDGYLHTISGKFIQIRTKDAGGSKSKPIYSKNLKRNVTPVSRMAFYFLATFKNYINKNSVNNIPMKKNNYEIFQGNCLEVMDKLFDEKGEFVDFIFADPPYFLSNGGITCQNGKMVKVDKGDWDVSKGADINHEFNLEWIKRCQKILKPNGSMMVSGTLHVIYSVGFAMQQLNMKLLNNITWQKPNPPPNLACRYFTHSTETIIWSAKTLKSKHLFNYDLMRKFNENKQMKDVWNFTAPKQSEKKHGRHPTQKPLDLLSRILLAATNQDDLVLDPFNGSGTTGVACALNNRKYIGIELEKSYIELTKKRINDINNQLF